jgi:hypothetical protein
MIDLQKFVELANKCAPELGAVYEDEPLGDGPNGFFLGEEAYYCVGKDMVWNGPIVGHLLEYLKGLHKLSDVVNINPYYLAYRAEYKTLRIWSGILSNPWHSLTPEAVIQACIDYWEAME